MGKVLTIITCLSFPASIFCYYDILDYDMPWSIFRGSKVYLWNLIFITFMTKGIILNFQFRNKINRWQSCYYITLTTALLLTQLIFYFNSSGWLTWEISLAHPSVKAWIIPFAISLAIFLVLSRFNSFICKSQTINELSNISYPLYVVHGVPGYVIIYLSLY